MPTQSETIPTELTVNLQELEWHPSLKRLPLMADISTVQARKLKQKEHDVDQVNAKAILEFTTGVALTHSALKFSIGRGLVEKIIVSLSPEDGNPYLVDGRDRTSALIASGIFTTVARVIPWKDVAHTIRAQLLRKPGTQYSRAFAGAEEYPQLLDVSAGNPALSPFKEEKKLPLPVQDAIVAHRQLENLEDKRGEPRNRSELALMLGVSRTILGQAYETLKLVLDREAWEAKNPSKAAEPGYLSANYWVKRVFSNFSPGGVIKGLKNSAAKEDDTNTQGANPGAKAETPTLSVGRLRTSIGSWGAQGRFWSQVKPDELTELEEHARKAISQTDQDFRSWWVDLLKSTPLPKTNQKAAQS